MRCFFIGLLWLYSNCIFLGCHCCPCVKEDVGDGYDKQLPSYNIINEVPSNTLVDKCAICLSLYKDTLDLVIIKTNCNHYFHKNCIDGWFKEKLICPVCKTVLNERVVGRGPCGTMTISLRDNINCPGYNCGMLLITFDMQDVYKGARFGKLIPGDQYYRNENVYVPNNDSGLELLGYYIEAFKKKLLFIFGQSVTRGSWGIVFGSIHFKTEPDQFGGYQWGYSDNIHENDRWIADTIGSVRAFGIKLASEEARNIARQNIGNVIKVF